MDKIIETFGLTKYYPKGIIGIKDLSLTVHAGEIYGFLGSNGAGKTTMIRLLLNLIFPTSGRGRIFNKDIVKERLEICKDTGYIPGSIRPHRNMTGEDFLDYMGRFFAKPDVDYRRQLLDRFEFASADLHRHIKQYSSGMARKIAIVQAFQHHPRLLIMDEPTEGLDPVMQYNFYELLKDYRNNGGTAFISSHHLREVEQVCDGAAIIRKGKLVAVEKVKDLMDHMARPVHVRFKNAIDRFELESDAWEIISLKEKTVHARLSGDMDVLIKFLAKFEVEDLSLPNLSLEDIFLSYYQEEENQ
ncbi:MAG: ABC transporter ATP-binding protein [Candidatus Aminicenantes bacterium]|nr:ABC transporter ATP-binding protein [Candidatus Aminicenantes bacterium]